jgi:hypothetical protein
MWSQDSPQRSDFFFCLSKCYFRGSGQELGGEYLNPSLVNLGFCPDLWDSACAGDSPGGEEQSINPINENISPGYR